MLTIGDKEINMLKSTLTCFASDLPLKNIFCTNFAKTAELGILLAQRPHRSMHDSGTFDNRLNNNFRISRVLKAVQIKYTQTVQLCSRLGLMECRLQADEQNLDPAEFYFCFP